MIQPHAKNRMATSIIKEKANRMKIVVYAGVTVNGGYCVIPIPSGYNNSDYLIIQPIYISSGILGWTAYPQWTSSGINLYIRQGTATPANNSKISFYAIFIKA